MVNHNDSSRIHKSFEALSAIALTEFDASTRFRAMAAKGNPEEGLRLLAMLDDLAG